MEKNSFFKTKEGGLQKLAQTHYEGEHTEVQRAFMFGLYTGTTAACAVGFVIMMAAMFYSPVKVFILTPKHK